MYVPENMPFNMDAIVVALLILRHFVFLMLAASLILATFCNTYAFFWIWVHVWVRISILSSYCTSSCLRVMGPLYASWYIVGSCHCHSPQDNWGGQTLFSDAGSHWKWLREVHVIHNLLEDFMQSPDYVDCILFGRANCLNIL